MGVLADLIALVNGNTEKTLDVLIQEKATETNGKVDAKASQTSVNNLDTKVQTGNNLIGATNNTGGTTTSGSIFAKLNKLLTDWTTTRAGYLDNINANVGTLINGRVVKSVQRGVFEGSNVGKVIINHNYVDLNKSILIFNGASINATPYYGMPIRFSLRETTRFTLWDYVIGRDSYLTWELIEFY